MIFGLQINYTGQRGCDMLGTSIVVGNHVDIYVLIENVIREKERIGMQLNITYICIVLYHHKHKRRFVTPCASIHTYVRLAY